MIIDITPSVSCNIAVWPGDTPFSRKVLMDMHQGANIALSSIESTLHLGAHADAPSHYIRDGQTIDQLDLDPYIGPCQVVSVQVERNALICPEMFQDRLLAGVRRVLFRTGTFPDPETFNTDFAAFHPDSIDLLGRKGVLLAGVDTPSFDGFSSKELPSHQMLARWQIRNLEGLVLTHVPDGTYELIALPLRIAGADASPVRAVLRTVG